MKGIAVTSDVTPRYCLADPVAGGKQAVAEAWRNLTAVGSVPLAYTDNMNFGNPQKPEIMGQFVGCIEGLREAGLALAIPVVSGNCSHYNETNGQGILPTPTIGGVGLLSDVRRMATFAFKHEGDTILLIGDTKGHLGSSIYLREIHGREDGPPPPVDLATEKRNGDFVRTRIIEGRLTAVHDCSDGGLLVALAEMAMASNLGASIAAPQSLPAHAFLYGEDQARYVVTARPGEADKLIEEAVKAGVPCIKLGQVEGTALKLNASETIPIARLKTAHESWFPRLMAGPDALIA
jgi:phosphoribosylformylglycinamidine synthase